MDMVIRGVLWDPSFLGCFCPRGEPGIPLASGPDRGWQAMLQSIPRRQHTQEDLPPWQRCSREILTRELRTNFWLPCRLGKPALVKRKQVAPKERLGYNPNLQVLAIYGVLEKERTWFNVTDSPWCAIFPTKQAIHSGCFVSARISAEVTFNSDTVLATVPKTLCSSPKGSSLELIHIVFQHLYALLFNNFHSLSLNSNATSLIKNFLSP